MVIDAVYGECCGGSVGDVVWCGNGLMVGVVLVRIVTVVLLWIGVVLRLWVLVGSGWTVGGEL